MSDLCWNTAAEIAAAVRSGEVTAAAVVEAALARIAAEDGVINAFTEVTGDRARAEAAAIDAQVAGGGESGPLAGVPFAVKNLFDVAGLPTLAGSRINRGRPPAAADAALVRRLGDAGAVLVGALNMGEFAYDFTGENAHDGVCRNPHDPTRMSGGSSSGSGAAAAAGFAPITLGSDTNGSLRVPASLCGVFSLKPTYGRLPRTGAFPFVDSLDHLGPLARSARDLALAYDALQGHDPADHACARRPSEHAAPSLDTDLPSLRIGVPGGWLAAHAGEDAQVAAEAALRALVSEGAEAEQTDLDEAEAGRAAAYLITNSEGAAFHLDRLRSRAGEFDPDTRDRFLAGALLPAAWIVRAQRVRRWWLDRALAALAKVDAILLPATPCSAPRIGERTLRLCGKDELLRPNLGLLSQPFSCIGLPVVTVPVFSPGSAPIGVQIVCAPWREDLALRIARRLERAGVAAAHPPPAHAQVEVSDARVAAAY